MVAAFPALGLVYVRQLVLAVAGLGASRHQGRASLGLVGIQHARITSSITHSRAAPASAGRRGTRALQNTQPKPTRSSIHHDRNRSAVGDINAALHSAIAPYRPLYRPI